jgi:adenine-specific DNA-methyltransferase
MNLLEELKSVLKKDERLVSDDKLLKNRIVELGLKLDKDLIKLLLGNKRIKEHFFTEVDSTLVFDKEKFMKFIDNKEFLPNSYTAFKNKIGLTADKRYIAKNKEVVLSWPYKDCILEGGQEKGDEKRKEIFHNEILAPDEIDRLLEPKVFTIFKKINAKGEHKVSEIKPNDNLIIKGNNLLVLHSLKKRFAGKVKLIYIDPPYNTGNDEFKYNDSFNHSTWLTFMRNRLEVAKELLRDDGVIFVQIDFNEHGYLKILCDEIFGRDNFVNEIVWKRRGGKTSPDTNRLENVCDYILLYRKRDQFEINFLYTKADSEKYIESQFKYQDSDGRRYRLSPLNAPQYRPTLVYDFMGYKPHPNGWSVTKNRLQELYEQGKLVFPKDKNGRVNRKQYLDEWEGYAINSLWTDITSITGASKERTGMMRGQKPEKLIKRVLELGSNGGDIILDFFLGSGTTAAVAHKMGRQYIGVEQLDYGENDSVVKLKNVIGKANSKGKLAEVIED